ncbi:CoA transferase [Georgenia subflava]|uniref:CoA transferase n=1 Tax=Georgenia subflava TaxID=1622177 RepID=A0A6N7EMW4_9MICO|nr:CoA transferase [Georgenia subflava]MPV37486.1 hypothetical protein [Georgenia subflava]
MGTQELWPELVPGGAPEVPVTGPRRWWAGPLDVEGLVVAAVRSCAAAAAALGAERGAPVELSVDVRDVAAAVESFRHLRVDGRTAVGFAPLSRFFPTADRWVRFHANYPHHRAALLAALDVPDDDGADLPDRVAAVVAAMPAEPLEARVRERGGVAAALRTPQEWLAHAQGHAVAQAPLVQHGLDRVAGGTAALPRGAALPMSGLRVLDLTRVIAGPTATRMLGALGADVLRIDPPDNPELLDQYLDTGFAKRSAAADLHDPAERDRIEQLLPRADLVLSSYRPGALARLGLDAAALRERHPHLVVVELSAWGTVGPWGRERGFDSIVQVATGIAHRYGTDDESWRPGALPVQALDHAAGYLAAATAMRSLTRREQDGGASARISLARVAHELLRLPVPTGPAEHERPPVRTATVPSAYGPVEHVPPPLGVGGRPLGFPGPPQPYAGAAPVWL